MKLLDGGALGIICPMVNTPEDAQAFVGAMRYAPEGYRSSGPTGLCLSMEEGIMMLQMKPGITCDD